MLGSSALEAMLSPCPPHLASRALISHCAKSEEKPSCRFEILCTRLRSGRAQWVRQSRSDKLSTNSSAWPTRSCAGWLGASSAAIRATRLVPQLWSMRHG